MSTPTETLFDLRDEWVEAVCRIHDPEMETATPEDAKLAAEQEAVCWNRLRYLASVEQVCVACMTELDERGGCNCPSKVSKFARSTNPTT